MKLIRWHDTNDSLVIGGRKNKLVIFPKTKWSPFWLFRLHINGDIKFERWFD